MSLNIIVIVERTTFSLKEYCSRPTNNMARTKNKRARIIFTDNRNQTLAQQLKGKNMMLNIKKLGIAALAVAALAMGGCASTNKYGQECVVGQTCGFAHSEISGEVLSGMRVSDIVKNGTEDWNKGVKVAALTFKMTEAEVLSAIGDRDMALLKKYGFTTNRYGWVPSSDLKVGDVIDMNAGKVGGGVLPSIVRIVKRAGE